MRTIKKLIPGKPGTKKHVAQYGKNLVCVRYRHDEKRKRKLTTVEIIVEDVPLQQKTRKPPMNKIVNIRIEFGEIDLGRMVRSEGGRWNRDKKVWELPFKKAIELKLLDRIIE